MADRMLPSPRLARYSGKDRPDCLMNQTGTRLLGRHRHALRKGDSDAFTRRRYRPDMAEGWATKLAFPLTPRRPHKEHVATHPDLEAEQSYIDHAYQRLEAMRAISRQMMEGVLDRG